MPEPSVGGVRIMSAGTACDNDRCSVLVYNPEGPRPPGSVLTGCPSCGQDGFEVRFGIGLDAATPPARRSIPCSTEGCDGDGRYAAPGRGHAEGCTHPLAPEES